MPTSGSPTASSGSCPPFARPSAGPDRFSFGVIGDFGIGTPAARANLRRLSADPAVDLALTTGDNAQIYGTEDEYRRFVLGPLRELIATKPFWPSVGNHDYYNLQNYLRFFALPNGGLYYSFTYGGVLFVALDSNRFDARQRRWLRAELRGSTARCKVAYFHHPLWSSGRGYRGHTRHLRRKRFIPILERGGVDLVLNGHVQNYERSKPLRSGRRSRRRHRVRRDRRGRCEPERVRHQAPAEVVRAAGCLLPPPADPGGEKGVPGQGDRRRRQHAGPVPRALPPGLVASWERT